jgi:hypothetical protein
MRPAVGLRSKGSKKNLTKKRAGIALTPLTVDEVRRLPKPHAGFLGLVDDCVSLVHDFPNELSGSDIDVAGMEKDQANATVLVARRAALAKELALVDDTLVSLNSRIWTQEMIIYAHARVAARSNMDVKRAIEPIERFLKHAAHKKVAPPPSTTTSSSTASSSGTSSATTAPSIPSMPNTSGGTVT